MSFEQYYEKIENGETFSDNWRNSFLQQLKYLEQIDFQSYIDKYKRLDDLWNAVEEDYDNTELSNNELLQGNIFNYINKLELREYIEDKYKVHYREVISYLRQ